MTDEQAEQVARAIFGRWYPRIDYDAAHEEVRSDMRVIAREELESAKTMPSTRPWWEPN
jgi:hypothetical protein